MNKIQNVGIYILAEYGKEAGTIELNKLYYLVDVASYRLFGETLSGVRYIRAEKGPYSREISRELCLLEGRGVIRETKPSKGASTFPKVAWSIDKSTVVEPDLEAVEKELIDQVLRKVKGLAPRDLEKLSYNTEPMLDVLDQEAKNTCPLLQEKLDFGKIKRDEFMQKFLANSQRPMSEEEQECMEFCNKEWAEVELLLKSH